MHCSPVSEFALAEGGKVAGLVAFTMLLVSCAALREGDRCAPADVVPLPDAYGRDGGGEGAMAPNAWWRTFGDPQLDRLVETALRGSPSVARAAAALDQAAALARQRGATLWPELSVNGSAGGTRGRAEGTDGTRTTSTTETYSLGLAASYEVDLWGRVRATRDQARANWEASQADLETAAMTLAGTVTTVYLDWLAQHRKRELFAEQLESAREQRVLIELRFRRSGATALDVLQQQESVAGVEASLPPVDERLQKALHQLAVLTGKPPTADLNLTPLSLPVMPPQPELGLPVQLLERRPDIRAAWARVLSADRQVAQAHADRLPALRLTAAADYQSDAVSALFNNWALSLVANLVGPLVDGGRRTAEVERTRAVVAERVAQFHAAVLAALMDVHDALLSEASQTDYVAALRRQRVAVTRAYKEAHRRYGRGAESYLQVLTLEDRKRTLDALLVQAESDALAARVRLYRSLGGDWRSILESLETISDRQETTP